MTTLEPAKPVLFLGREPVQWVQLASGLLIFLTPFLHLSDGLNGAILAALTALFGFLTALAVSKEKAAPAVAGLIKALIALAVAFRLNFSAELQSGIMVFVEAGVAFYLRTQVFAPKAFTPALADSSDDPRLASSEPRTT